MTRKRPPNVHAEREQVPAEGPQQLLLLDDSLAFDEMNLVELPFALLTDAREANANPVGLIPLSFGGDEKLVASSGSALPTALAERVVLGLLWLTMSQSGFRSPTIRFGLRSLIHDYMYPQRSSASRVGGAFFKRVEQEIRRIAHTRIVSSRWYDKQLARTTHMDAAIIDYVQVIEEGGRNKPRVLEIRWGEKLFKSVCDRYTKSIDVRTILQIDRPLDLRFYRWLDRQLGTKNREVVHSCQNFARYKLLMRGEKIERGGRTASSYIVRKLKEALERLDTIGFSVLMRVDESRTDYTMEFERKTDPAAGNETVVVDHAGDLVREFYRLAHGRPRGSKRRRIAAVDRAEAERWLEDYGREGAAQLVRRCVELHARSRRKEEPLYSFKGLSLYEAKAATDTERHDDVVDLDALKEQASAAWRSYRDELLTQARARLSRKALAELRTEVAQSIAREYKGRAFKPEGAVLDTLIKVAVDSRILEEAGAQSEEQFTQSWLSARSPAA